jgi:cyclophilin family peptidyl-prolyl cis-trans isomerase
MKEILRDSAPILILLLVCAVLIGGISWWIGGGSDALLSSEVELLSEEPLSAPLKAEELEAYQVDTVNDMNPVAVLETNKGVVEIELFDDSMPITAGNFVKLVDEGFYDGIKFHRVIDGFMVQGGDPNTKTDQVFTYGQGGPEYSIPDEHIEGDLLSNVRGTISMANSGPNSGGSQFFINLVDNTNLDFNKPPLSSKHPVFGRVVSGMDVVDAISGVETGPSNLPVEDVVIEKATIRRDS